MIPFMFFPGQKTLVYFLPLALHFVIGIADFIKKKVPNLYAKTSTYVEYIRTNHTHLHNQKAKLEIMLFVFLIVFLFFGQSNIILLIFYANFLKTKYMLNNSTKWAFYEIDQWVTGVTNHRFCPGIFKYIIDKIRQFCGYMVKV